MIAVCVRYLKSEDDALEVINDAFLKVFSKLKQYQKAGSLEGWIKRIVINSSIDFVRSNKEYKSKFTFTDEFPLHGSTVDDDDASDTFSVADSALTADRIFELVKELPPATRVVFNLYVIDDFTHRQISEQLKIGEGTSKWHLSNARKLLKEKISQSAINENKNSNHGKGTFGLR